MARRFSIFLIAETAVILSAVFLFAFIPAVPAKEMSRPPKPALYQSLQLILRGTVNWDTPFAGAVIEDGTNHAQKLYKVGDIIKTGRIKKITRQQVVIGFHDQDVIVSMTTGAYVAEKTAPSVATIRRSDIESSTGNVKGLLSQIGIKAYAAENGDTGLLINSVMPGSMFDQLGFSQGDIIEEINGAKIQSPRLLAAIIEGVKRLPAQVLSLEHLDSNAAGLILKLNPQAGGIVREVAKVHQKIKSGDDIPVRLNRNGKSQIRMFRIE